MWKAQINDKDITIKKNTLELNDSVEENNNAHFSFKNNDYLPLKPTQRVSITYDNKNKFNGYINTLNQTFSYGADLTAEVDCIGQDYLLTKRTITKAFVGQKTEDIVKYIIDNVLAQEGITAGKINAPVVIPKIAFDSLTCMEALDQLMMFGDYVWNITNEKKINFHTIEENISNIVLDFSAQDCIALGSEYTLEEDYGNYRNTVILKGVKGLSPREEILKCDGNATSWNLKMNVGTLNNIQVDYKDGRGWIACTFAPNTEENANGNYMFLYDTGSNQITQYTNDEDVEEDGTNPNILKSGCLIKVEYQGSYDLSIRYSDYVEVEKQKMIDKTSGINEVVEEVNIQGLANAISYIKNNINKNKKTGYRLTFNTDKTGLKTLQYIKVILPQLNINEYFLITNVREYEDNEILYEITIVSGTLRDSFLTDLFGDRQAYTTELQNSQSQDTANISLLFEKTWTEDETPNMFSCNLFPSNDLFPSDTLFPCLPETERIQYIQLYRTVGTSYVPFLRVPVAGDELDADGNIYLCTAVIDDTVSFEDYCTAIGWIASDGYNPCTATDFASGIEIVQAPVEQPFNKVKDLEFITIFRIDTSWEVNEE